MAHRNHARALSPFAALAAVFFLAHAAAAQPAPTAVVSRMTHAAAGAFDLPLPQGGAGGIESRSLAGGVQVVVTFDKPVTGGAAAMAPGNAFATVNGAPTFSGNTMTVQLIAVQNAKTIALVLTNVTDNVGGTLPSADIFFRTLEGDLNASGTVTAADVNLATANVNKPLTYANFRADVSVTNGQVSPADTALVKARINTSVGAGPAPNTPPTLAALADQTTPVNTPLPSVFLTVADAESSPDMLSVVATSSNPAVVANSGLAVSASGSTRTLSITPVADAVGTTTISVKVSDGVLTTSGTFVVTVGAAQKLFLADLRANGTTVNTRGRGTASLLLSADETQATLRFNYDNLTSNKTGAAVRGPAAPNQLGPVLFDCNTATPQGDGSYVWGLGPVGATTTQDIKDALRAGRLYFTVNTTAYTTGELRGQFYLATATQSFTPPPKPPATVPGTPDQDAARFLTQATFGPAAADIDALRNLPGGINAWLDQQFAAPTTSMYEILKARVQQTPPNVYAMGGGNITDIWWKIALTGNDQLRQRVAFALSEIFVVSKVEDAINERPAALATYHDMLADNAFANFRKLLEDVTLHPMMGQYLNMRGNKKPVSPNFTAPNENYAREILQLFSVGVYDLHPDGSLKLGADGAPIPTYDQDTIQAFAHVFTGWDLNQTNTSFPYWNTALATPGIDTYSTRYIRPMVVTASNHSNNAKVLLRGTTIPARATHTTATANDELRVALDNIFQHPNVGPFICKQLIQRLVTSDPSRGYVYRVAEVFRDNGAGVRGDMRAVVKAILTDYEARSVDVIGNASFGRLKEPLLRLSHVVRALHPFSNAAAPLNYFRIASTDSEFLQTVYRSPTVFNFFEPTHLIDVKRYAGTGGPQYRETINAPEMQITSESTVVSIASVFRKGLVDGTGFTNGTDVRVNLATENALCTSTTNSAPIIDLCNKVFLAGSLPSVTRTQLDNYYRSRTSTNDSAIRARGVIYLTVTSPHFAVQK